ncbi:hypothetical protein [Mycobacterium triplex]|uniref:hypothetical protein n=1 Tax=Mycobacterium triplex TaxID=47839 RepID=UPI0018DB08AF|nr:hypothetical protein [Mycobacterium triplex]
MFEFSPHNVNGLQWTAIPADNLERVLGAGGWRIDYLGVATYPGAASPGDIRGHEDDGSRGTG